MLKEGGVVDTGLLKGKIGTTTTLNPFRLSWDDSARPIIEVNYSNGTIAKLYFKAKDGFCGTTDINVDVVADATQTFVDNEFILAPPMESGVISVTRPKLAIKDGVAIANSVDGETLIIANYDEDGMIDCKVYPNSTGDVKLTIADEINTTGATKVKAFLWENLKTLVPVCNCAEEEL